MPTIQATQLGSGVHDGAGDAGLFGGRIEARHGLAGFAADTRSRAKRCQWVEGAAMNGLFHGREFELA
jgi:hypothetical protein